METVALLVHWNIVRDLEYLPLNTQMMNMKYQND
ncbi:MAG: hypothetical protein JPMHGGIA_02658 [Saprospiraceae bacterium]|jgi:hypothetical protein|nr:hypothetical protein [Saprospiraceae bacterium]